MNSTWSSQAKRMSRGKGLGLRVVLPPRGGSRLPPTIPQPLPVPPGTRTQQPTRSPPPNNGFTAPRAPILDEILLEDLERQNPPLGKGSSGRVYKVIHRKTGKVNIRSQFLTTARKFHTCDCCYFCTPLSVPIESLNQTSVFVAHSLQFESDGRV